MSRSRALIRASKKAAIRASLALPDGMSIETVLGAVRDAVYAKYPGSMAYVEATDDATVVVKTSDACYRHKWTIGADHVVTLSADAEKVVEKTTFEVVASYFATVLAAVDAKRLRCRVIGTGFGQNFENGRQWFVPDSADGIGSARKTFGGSRVHWHKVAETFDHVEVAASEWLGTDHDIGYLSDLAVSADGLEATLNLDDDVPDFVRAALVSRQVGLSIEASADRRPGIRDGKAVVELVNFRHGPDGLATVAIVSNPALRGEVLRVAASAHRKEKDSMNREQALKILASTTATPEQVAEARKVLAATEPAPVATPAIPDVSGDVAAIKAAREAIEREVKITAATKALDGRLTLAKLPAKAEKLVRASFDVRVKAGESIPETEIDAAVKDAREAIGAPVAAGVGVEVGAEPHDKLALRLERLLMGNQPKYAKERFSKLWAGANGKSLEEREQAAGIGYADRTYSFREAFRGHNGFDIKELWAAGRRSQTNRLRASINLAAFGDVFENVLNVMGLAMQENPDFSAWRQITNIVPISGTKKQERVVIGGYANLPTVAEGANYTAATTPADEGQGYTPVKKGYTEDWTEESILNDNISALSGIVQKMAVAADRTKYEYVFDLVTIAGMPTMDYDSIALLHASSRTVNNLNTSALTATSLAAARLGMMKQPQLTNSKRMALQPRFLLCPLDLQETAENLLKPSVQEPGGLTSEREFLRRMNLSIIPVRHWTNTGDWFLVADPNNGLVPVFEMGFEGGREMAEITIQDAPNVGSVFERDAVTVKVKQPHFGGSPIRHEAFYGNDV